MKFSLRHTMWLFEAIVVAAVVWVGCNFYEQFAAASSVEELAEGVYTFTYRGDYGFDDFLAEGGASSADEMARYITRFLTRGMVSIEPETMDFGCSFLSMPNADGGYVVGRNFDWSESDSDMVIVHTHPTNGYSSVATCNVDFLGFGDGWKPRSLPERMMLLAAIYVPLDGMNEKGLCVADLIAGDDEVTNQQTARADVTTTSAIRLVLDRAATVEEALALLVEYDMHSDIGRAHHLAISDRTGRSVVVEWVDGQMVYCESNICTNHYLAESPKRGVAIGEDSFRRYNTLSEFVGKGFLIIADAITAMGQVSDEGTRWTVIFDTEALTATYFRRGDFSIPYIVKIEN